MKYAIGVDIGGTKISISLGTSSGRILIQREIPTQKGLKVKQSLRDIIHAIHEIIRSSGVSPKNILGIGVGIPGAVNTNKGIVPRSPNLPGWANMPLRKILTRAVKLPVLMANDANAAGLGESLFGAGRNVHNLIYITVSTGVGGGIIVKSQLYEGSGFVAGEIGHMSIVPEGNRCACGKRGCLEAYASGTAIARYVSKHITRNNTAIWKFLPANKKISARQVGIAARQGDKLAIESYRMAAYYLGIGIANLLNILNPGKVVIGGGVLKSAPKIFWQSMIRSTQQHAWPEAFRTVKIVRSQLRGQVGDLGALALVFQQVHKRPS